MKHAVYVVLIQGELLLSKSMAALVEDRVSDNTDSHAEKGPRGPNVSRPLVQIHVHEEVETGRISVQADAGEREQGCSDAECIRVDAPARFSPAIITPARLQIAAERHAAESSIELPCLPGINRSKWPT